MTVETRLEKDVHRTYATKQPTQLHTEYHLFWTDNRCDARRGFDGGVIRRSPVRCTVELRLGLQPQTERLTLPNSSTTIKTDAGEDDMVCPLSLFTCLTVPFVFTKHAGRTKNRSDKLNEGASD